MNIKNQELAQITELLNISLKDFLNQLPPHIYVPFRIISSFCTCFECSPDNKRESMNITVGTLLYLVTVDAERLLLLRNIGEKTLSDIQNMLFDGLRYLVGKL